MRTIVFCDFDATFWNIGDVEQTVENIDQLVSVLNRQPGDITFGWVTGSSTDRALGLVQSAGCSFTPDFVSGDLGTDLRVRNGNRLVPDHVWKNRLDADGYSHERVQSIVGEFEQSLGVPLVPQQERFPAFKCNYYLSQDDVQSVDRLRQMTTGTGIRLNVNKCNPDAGDPEGFFDVDFIPASAGKAETVAHLLEDTREDTRSYGFGDSGNDLAMLARVDCPWLVANATAEAKQAGFPVTDKSYLGGVVEVLDSIGRE